MLLPLAVYLAMYDIERSKALRWFPVICIAVAIPASVSRSAILAVGWLSACSSSRCPPAHRLRALAAVAVGVAAIFMTSHGLIGTLKSFFLAGTSDPSVAHRVNNYPFVEQLVRAAPWFGQGGGTYIAQDAVHILDNQYLTTAIELGLVGVAALAFSSLAGSGSARRPWPHRRPKSCVTFAPRSPASALAATLCSATFDSLSFPMFVNVQALVVGLIGAAWLLAGQRSETALDARSFRQHINRTVNRRQRARPASRRAGWRELMDLLSIPRAIWRQKLATIPVILLTVLGVFYVVAVKPPVYQATASFLLVNPSAPPTQRRLPRIQSWRRQTPTIPTPILVTCRWSPTW